MINLNKNFDKLTMGISSGFLILFVIIALIDSTTLASIINLGFKWSTKYFGLYWQVLLLMNFLIGMWLAFGKTGNVILGNTKKPEISTFQWLSIVLCTLLAGGGVFWAAAEPIAHFINPTPLYGDQPEPFLRSIDSLSQSFMHWGFLAWAILGTLTTILLMYLHYEKGLPLKPRTLLYPIFGDRIINSWMGSVVDGFAIISAAAGTIGPIGFLGLQVSYSLNVLFGVPNTFIEQAIIVVIAIIIYTVSAISGLKKGIERLSRWNVILAIVLMLYIFVFGPTRFILDSYVQSLGSYLSNFMAMATYRANIDWLNSWTVFFWGWFLGYGPIMAIFMAKISNGKSIKSLIISISIIAPLITMFWFTIVGGSGLAFEISNPGVISEAFKGFNLPASLLAITQSLPLPIIISVLFLILTSIFIITTGDSITYTISMVIEGNTKPNSILRGFWGILMGALTIILISIGSGGISALQSFIIITAVPVSLVLLPALWYTPIVVNKMVKKQGL